MIPFISAAAAVSTWMLLRLLRPREALAAQRLVALSATAWTRQKHMRALERLLETLGGLVPGTSNAPGGPISAAGVGYLSPRGLRGAQVLLAALGILLSLNAGRLAIVFAPAMAAPGWHAPMFFLKMRAQARKQQIASALPDAVDLLAVCTQAGLNVALSLKRVSEATEGLLGDELRKVVTRTELGEPRSTALGQFAAGSGLPDAAALAACLASAEAFGSELSDSLSVLSAEMRQRRRRSVEEQARKAPVKILFPLVFVILPAFLLLTVVPLLMGTLDTLSLF